MSAIIFEDVYKKYSYHRHKYKLLSEELSSLLTLGFLAPKKELEEGQFWALRGINFQINPGENVGIIGPNGSGKSTILKLIAKIAYPTKGRVTTNGRIGALIELGAGLHPELTGEENIYLYGTILGMRSQEIKRKFPEIVELANLKDFLETPIKHYSAGMKARLGFSVAILMDPDILLVDEVLSVGDIDFQKKSEKKMLEFKDSGRTLIFISHNMDAVKKVCSRVILIEKGKVKMDGPTDKVITAYKATFSAG